MNFGEKFSRLVNDCELTHQQLADALGFKSKSHINYYMNLKKRPSPDILDRICDYFGVGSDFFSEKATPTRFKQNEKEYVSTDGYIPILSDESVSAVPVGRLDLSGLGIHEGFVIVADDRISSLGFPVGSALYFSTKFDEALAGTVIIQQGESRYFAMCEQRGNNIVILPCDREKPAVTLDRKAKSDVQIYAVLQGMFSNLNIV